MRILLIFAFLGIQQGLYAQAKANESFEIFFKTFLTSFQKGDFIKVADLTAFPMNAADISYPIKKMDTTVEDITREVFIKYIGKVITKKHLKILSQSPHTKTELYGEESECYAVVYASGKDWKAWFVFCKGLDGWKWVFTDNVSM